MARIGVKKTYSAGTLDDSALDVMFAAIKQAVVDSGASVLVNTDSEIEWMPGGATAADTSDDMPHWAITLDINATPHSIEAWAVHGQARVDANALVAGSWLMESNPTYDDGGTPVAAETDFWFAVDGTEGWFWFVTLVDGKPAETVVKEMWSGLAGTRSRRLPADNHQGLAARYGLLDVWGTFYPPYSVTIDGSVTESPNTKVWTPAGIMGGPNPIKRHIGSPLPRLIYPMYPAGRLDIIASAALAGDMADVMSGTDGWALEEAPIPGWIAIVSENPEADPPLIVKAPPNWTVLP